MKIALLVLFHFAFTAAAAELYSQPRRSRFMLSAPHGGFDLQTEKIAADVSWALKWNAAIAVGYRTHEHPYNVNRPTEGANLPPELEKFTQAAKLVYAGFLRTIQQAGRADLYVEIHGNSREQSEGFIEIATTGISVAQARTVKAVFTEALRASRIDRTQVLVEGVDSLYFLAGAAKRHGTLGIFAPALHIELPWRLRDKLLPHTESFLVRALGALSVPRRP